ncbi:choice-of-anchor A family protein [Catellatospora coxensis]|nr:choice-of-anchor A family protein [Catellatospora coxensis]
MQTTRMRGIVAATALLSAAASAMLVMVAPDPARAVSPASPTAAALGFNVFAEGDATLTGNETEGPVALGGTLTIGGSYEVAGASPGTYEAPLDDVPSALVIGGAINFTASSATILDVQQGYAKLGDPTGADVRDTDDGGNSGNTHIVAEGASYGSTPRVELRVEQPVDSVLRDSGIDFATAFADFRSSSTDLAGCTNTVVLKNANGDDLPQNLPPMTNAYINLGAGTNVLNITAANLANISTLTFVTPPTSGTPLLINVDTAPGNTFNWTVPTPAGIGGTDAPFLLWNFPTATAITLTGSSVLEGTLYAPNADVTDLNSNNIEGQVIVASLIHGTAAADGGEMHYFPFTAPLNCVARATPDLTTVASADITFGGQIHDVARLAGGNNPTGTITFQAYGPDNAMCTGTAAFTTTRTVTRDGLYQSDDFTPLAAGTYRWIATYSGDRFNQPAATSCADELEWVVVNPAVVTPALDTVASDDVALGGEIWDTATLTGGDSPTGTITFRLYGPDNAMCTGPAVFTSTVTLTDATSYDSERTRPTAPGTYRWVATYNGDENNAQVTTPCTDRDEWVVVGSGTVTPTLSTEASRDTYLGKEIYDRAFLSGGVAPTGTITFELYGPGDETCSGRPVFTSTVDVDGNGRYRSEEFRPRVPGTYRWVASYSGDDGNQEVRTRCDDPAERVVVKKKKPYGGKPRP